MRKERRRGKRLWIDRMSRFHGWAGSSWCSVRKSIDANNQWQNEQPIDSKSEYVHRGWARFIYWNSVSFFFLLIKVDPDSSVQRLVRNFHFMHVFQRWPGNRGYFSFIANNCSRFIIQWDTNLVLIVFPTVTFFGLFVLLVSGWTYSVLYVLVLFNLTSIPSCRNVLSNTPYCTIVLCKAFPLLI